MLVNVGPTLAKLVTSRLIVVVVLEGARTLAATVAAYREERTKAVPGRLRDVAKDQVRPAFSPHFAAGEEQPLVRVLICDPPLR